MTATAKAHINSGGWGIKCRSARIDDRRGNLVVDTCGGRVADRRGSLVNYCARFLADRGRSHVNRRWAHDYGRRPKRNTETEVKPDARLGGRNSSEQNST